MTLLDLGEDQVKVVSEYLTGRRQGRGARLRDAARTATLRRSLSECFVPVAAAPAEDGELTKDQVRLEALEPRAFSRRSCGARNPWPCTPPAPRPPRR